MANLRPNRRQSRSPLWPRRAARPPTPSPGRPGKSCIPHPSRVIGRLAGKLAPAPEFPLCYLGLDTQEVDRLYGRPWRADWWDSKFEIGRALSDSQYCAVWRALFESFAPVERALAPAYRFLIRARGSLLQGESVPNRTDVQSMACETASSSWELGVPPSEEESVLRAYVGEIPASVQSYNAQRDELVGPTGRLEPLGVTAGMVFAVATRASYGARSKWFQSLGWWKVSRILRALAPSSKTEKLPLTGRVGFDNLVHEEAF